MAWMGGWFDPELEDLFRDEPELLQTAQRVRAARPQVDPDARFQNRLRAQLVAEASRGAGARGVRRWWRLGPGHVAWGGAFVGAALITATVFTFVANHPTDQTVTAFSQLTAQHSVSPSQVITVAFNQPMDQHAVEAGVHIQPAIKVSFTWKDNDLVITPAYHLSANTPYTVTIAQTAIRAASGASAAAPINITFGTAPTPTPGPVAPPSLNPVTLGSNGTGGSLFYASDGSLISTVGLLPTSAAATSSSTPTPASPSASPTTTPEGGITGAPEVPGALVQFSGGTSRQLGPSPSAAAFSPERQISGDCGAGRQRRLDDCHQPERRKPLGAAVQLAGRGDRTDVVVERSNHLYGRDQHRLGGSHQGDHVAVHTRGRRGNDHRACPGRRICLRRARERHRRVAAPDPRGNRAGALRRGRRRRVQR